MRTPKQAVVSGYWQYFDLAGRATRTQFFWFSLYLVVLLVSPSLVAGLIVEALTLTGREAESVLNFSNVVYLVLLATHICPLLTALARRYRDAGVSPWWLLLWVGFLFPGLVLSLVVAFMPTIPIQRSYAGVERRT